MWNLKNKTKMNLQIQRLDWWLPEAEFRGGELGEIGDRGHNVQIPSDQMEKSWGCNVQHGDSSYQYCIAYLDVTKRADLKCPHNKNKDNFVAMDVNQTWGLAILQCMQILTHCVLHLKLIQC